MSTATLTPPSRARTENDLGRCSTCAERSDLCISGGVVTCEGCGCPYPEHDVSVAEAASRAHARANPPKAITLAPDFFPHTLNDRTIALEKRAAKQDERIVELEKLVAGLGAAQPRLAKRTA